MRPFTIKQLPYDLTPVAGLALVGQHLQRLGPVFKRIDAALPVRTGVASSDIVRSYLGLLAQGVARAGGARGEVLHDERLDALERRRGRHAGRPARPAAQAAPGPAWGARGRSSWER